MVLGVTNVNSRKNQSLLRDEVNDGDEMHGVEPIRPYKLCFYSTYLKISLLNSV